MNTQKLMPVTYYDPDNAIRLTAYAGTTVWDDGPDPFLVVLRLGGYPPGQGSAGSARAVGR